MRTQGMAAAQPKATRSRKAASSKKAASAAKAPAKAKAKVKAKAATGKPKATTGKPKGTSRMNGVAAAAATTSNRGARSAAGSKGQATKTGKSSRRGGKTQQRRSAGSGKSSQQALAPERQGDSTMTPQAAAPMFGGTRQVLIEEVAMSNRGGRKQGPEPFPFGDLTPSRMHGGAILGPSFFIPDSENPKRIIAAGRKRHKGLGKVFLTRQMDGPSTDDPNVQVPGTRVWLAPKGYNG